jgi:hypothetical protein
VSKASAAMAKRAHAAVQAAKAYRPRPPLPEGLCHLFQEYVPTQQQVTVRKPRHVAPAIPLGENLMQTLVRLQLGICPFCDLWLEFDPEFGMSHPLRPSIDHVVPRNRGGRSLGNKLVMHRECNSAKGSRLPNGCELVWLAAVNAHLGL